MHGINEKMLSMMNGVNNEKFVKENTLPDPRPWVRREDIVVLVAVILEFCIGVAADSRHTARPFLPSGLAPHAILRHYAASNSLWKKKS